MRRFILAAVCGAVLLTPAAAWAQAERYEVGRRFRAFEVAWDKADAAGRKRALPPLLGIMKLFFAGKSAEVCQAFDQARFALRSKNEAPLEVALVNSLSLKP